MKAIEPRGLDCRKLDAKLFVFVVSLALGAAAQSGCRIPPPDFPSSGPEPFHYTIEASNESDIVKVTLDIPPFAHPLHLDLMGTPGRAKRRGGIHDGVHHVRCGDELAEKARGGGWILPAGCSTASWLVRAAPVGPKGYDVSSQMAVRSSRTSITTHVSNTLRTSRTPANDWVFLPGAALFLMPRRRMVPATVELRLPDQPVFTNLEPTPYGHYRAPPTPYLGLVFIGFGSYVSAGVSAKTVEVRHVFDKKPHFSLSELAAGHGRAISYLLSVLGQPKRQELIVFWFGLNAETAPVGGAAGYKAMALNYLIANPAPNKKAVKRHHVQLLMLLHEQFQIAGRTQAPAWLTESLAQYYALKSLRKAAVITEREHEALFNRLTMFHPAKLTLVELQRRVEVMRSKSARRAIYSLGLVFLRELDEAIHLHTKGKSDLDALARPFLNLNYGKHGKPMPFFWKLVRTAGGKRAVETIRKYVTGPDPNASVK
jgi:hypothetical protein